MGSCRRSWGNTCFKILEQILDLKRQAFACASFDEINDSVVKSERSELVRGSDSLLAYSAQRTAGDVWRAPTHFCQEHV